MAKKQAEPVLHCQIVVNCAGIKRPKLAGQKVQYRNYRGGEIIIGTEVNDSDVPTNYIPAIKTKDGFVVNRSNVIVVSEEQDAQVITEKDAPLSARLKEKYKSFSKVSGAQGLVKNQKKKTKYMLNGALAGGVVLAIYALMKGKNKTSYFIFGAVMGGLVGRMASGLTKDDEEEN